MLDGSHLSIQVTLISFYCAHRLVRMLQGPHKLTQTVMMMGAVLYNSGTTSAASCNWQVGLVAGTIHMQTLNVPEYVC
ncbi:hypothetical protein RJT34_06222 [Clitoria ternatea]|uniref:Uncharacterized protein n=1 Tax=Clitoria ternatea TaxID=43366 RepID=A0AAN9PTK3_CLITE